MYLVSVIQFICGTKHDLDRLDIMLQTLYVFCLNSTPLFQLYTMRAQERAVCVDNTKGRPPSATPCALSTVTAAALHWSCELVLLRDDVPDGCVDASVATTSIEMCDVLTCRAACLALVYMAVESGHVDVLAVATSIDKMHDVLSYRAACLAPVDMAWPGVISAVQTLWRCAVNEH